MCKSEYIAYLDDDGCTDFIRANCSDPSETRNLILLQSATSNA